MLWMKKMRFFGRQICELGKFSYSKVASKRNYALEVGEGKVLVVCVTSFNLQYAKKI